jgi:hypothetical protein
LVAAELPPQETDIINEKEIAKTLTANHQRRKTPPQKNWVAKWLGYCICRTSFCHCSEDLKAAGNGV